MASMTEAVLFRTTGTLGIDEFENLGSKDKSELRELLNAAYKKGIKITRMRKKKSVDGEQQVAESFDVYRPIVMANIWGMEEVLGDRCISLQLEKSTNPIITRLVENFDEFPEIQAVKDYFSKFQCSLCSVVTKKNIYTSWNTFIYTIYTNTTNNINNTNYTNELEEENEEFFRKIVDTNIDGRNLELFFPLFMISGAIGEDVLNETLDFAKRMVHDKRVEEVTESKDVMVFRLIASMEAAKYVKINEIVNLMRHMTNEGEMEWLNAKWMGRALKRLQLTVDKRRVGDGVEVTLDIDKAKKKMEMFNKE
jgi:hypothetical protein